MSDPFFDHPILNSPYEAPCRHWELDAEGQPTQRIIDERRKAEFITPIPKPKKRKGETAAQSAFVFDEGKGLSTDGQQYDPTSVINQVRSHVNAWRELPRPSQWQVTPETARLLQHWRSHQFGGIRPFFCQVEAVETAIWLTLGIDLRGRSRTLRVNYRTSHQIRQQADRLLGKVMTDIDGNSEDRGDTVSLFNGPPPQILSAKSEAREISAVAQWLTEKTRSGVLPHETGVFVRSTAQLSRAQKAVQEAGLKFSVLDEHVEPKHDHVSVCTMHLAKGLEFRAVAVMACDDEVIPMQERIEQVGDEGDLQEVYDTERHLLYVACTRARDFLLVSSVEPASEFVDDLRG
ncbi:MAG TPA: 3'-5' exonuclease [Candidatus Ozemobacteraceae bacterium]|nr:3'-5' exonuclease [Candidatus Ozemobacteraceae bacterium]